MARKMHSNGEDNQLVMLQTKYLGMVECDENSIVYFPQGLPGFDELRRFVCLEQPEFRPLIYLQSVENPQICFLTLPVSAIDTAYRLEVASSEGVILGMEGQPVVSGTNVIGLAILTTSTDQDPTANLLSPVVINVATRIGMQIVQAQSQYDWRHPLMAAPAAEAACL
jgi:flagellar assembly factor FliW